MKNSTSRQSLVTSHNTTLSVVLATRNEEANIADCLKSVENVFAYLPADRQGEVIIFDEESNDETVNVAKSFGAKVTKYVHTTNFHETKQKAIDAATGEWILQLDADERVSPELAAEIIEVINSSDEELLNRVLGNSKSPVTSHQSPVTSHKRKLFTRHQQLIEEREGGLGRDGGKVVAFFIPRVNFFVGQPLRHAGVYPDGVIRLFKRGKAHLPAKSVHEVMEVEGVVGWLFNDLEHHESPTLHRYLERANRYTDLTAKELEKNKIAKSAWQLVKYSLLLTAYYFLLLYIRHRGYRDGIRGFLWSFFSAMHHPLAYWKYYVED